MALSSGHSVDDESLDKHITVTIVSDESTPPEVHVEPNESQSTSRSPTPNPTITSTITRNGGSDDSVDQTGDTRPPPTYWQVPGTVPITAATGVGPPPSYQEVVDPNGRF